jgi:hypothetical protein
MRTAFRSPFMLGIQARLQVGPDRQREMLQGMLGQLNNRGAAAAGGPDFRGILERIAPDPTRLLVGMKDSLRLTERQVVRLQLVGDTLAAKNDVLIDSLAKMTPASGELRSMFQTIQPLLQQGRANYLAAVESIRSILTPEQWAQLPETFRNPRLPGRGPRGGAGRPQ